MPGPLDSANPIEHAWTSFRIAFSASTALRLLINELPEAAPDYLNNLEERIASAVSHGYLWAAEGSPDGEPFDGFVPIQGPGDGSVTFVPLEEAELLEDQLSFDASSTDDRLWLIRGLAVISLHSALENWARAAGASGPKLPEAIERHLNATSASEKLDSVTFRELAEFDATRHVFVHSAGVIDSRYLAAVRNSTLFANERRPVDDALLDNYSRLAWRIALWLRGADTSDPASA